MVYYCKSSEQRRGRDQEKLVANVSLCTGCTCCCCGFVIVLLIVASASASSVGDCNRVCSNTMERGRDVCMDSTGYCTYSDESSTDSCSDGWDHCSPVFHCTHTCQDKSGTLTASFYSGSEVCAVEMTSSTTCFSDCQDAKDYAVAQEGTYSVCIAW